MRIRHWASVALMLLLICAVSGCGPAAVLALQAPAESPEPLPNRGGSLKFCVLGDFGTGEQSQYQLAEQMATLHGRFKYDLVVLVGDNLYGAERPQDFQKKFEIPYKPLLDAGVKFYASLGNHDAREQRFYKLFTMGGKLYYTFAPKPNIRFFAFESTYPEPEQIRWLEKELAASNDDWKIVFFHHPLYSDGRFHGPDLDLRKQLMPIFEKYGVNVVLSGHDHVYERFKPEEGIYFFLVGNSGELRYHNLRQGSNIMAAGFDTDRTFMLVEISGDKLYFQTISRTGQTVDSGELQRQPKPQTSIQAQQQVR